MEDMHRPRRKDVLLQFDLPQFTIHTSPSDIKNSRSSFNPLPARAEKGASVWSGVAPNPHSGNMLGYVLLDESCTIIPVEIPLGTPVHHAPSPTEMDAFTLDDSSRFSAERGEWIPRDRFIAEKVSPKIIQMEAERADISESLKSALIQRVHVTPYGEKSEIPYGRPDAYLRVVRAVHESLQHYSWREALAILDSVFATGGKGASKFATLLNDIRQYPNESSYAFVKEVVRNHQRSTHPSDLNATFALAQNIHVCVENVLRINALDQALTEFSSSPGAQEHVINTRALSAQKLQSANEALCVVQMDTGRPYNGIVHTYFEANGVDLH